MNISKIKITTETKNTQPKVNSSVLSDNKNYSVEFCHQRQAKMFRFFIIHFANKLYFQEIDQPKQECKEKRKIFQSPVH